MSDILLYESLFPGHLRLEDEGFEEKKPPEALVLASVLTMLGASSPNAKMNIVGTRIFVRLFVSTSGQNRKYRRHTNMYMLVRKQRKTEPRTENPKPNKKHRVDVQKHRARR